MRAFLLFLPAMALAACSPDAEAPVETEVVEDGEGDAATTDAGDQSLADPAPGSVTAAAIPVRYHGVWDYVEGTCDPASDMRMEIDGRQIVFYESAGTVTGTSIEDGDAIVALDMEGEGETWKNSLRLSLVDGGERLHVTDGSAPKAPSEFPRTRCDG